MSRLEADYLVIGAGAMGLAFADTLVSGDDVEVSARRVVASHVEIVVPSMRKPSYTVAPGVECVAPNDLPRFRVGRDSTFPICSSGCGQPANF